MIYLLAIAAVLVMYFYGTRNSNYWKVRKVPFENSSPLFGNYIHILLRKETVGKYLEKLYKKFEGPYFGFVMLNRPYLVLRDSNIIKRILITDFSKFSNRVFAFDLRADPIMCNSLFAIKDSQWKILRAKLTPIFTSTKIKMAFPLLCECGNILQEYLEKCVDTSVDVKDIASKFGCDAVATYTFGKSPNSFLNKSNDFLKAGTQHTNNSFKRSASMLSYSFAPILVSAFRLKFFEGKSLRSAFIETMKQRETSKVRRNDLIDILNDIKNSDAALNDGFELNSDQLFSQAATFFLTGFDTTSTVVTYTLYELCLNEDIQDRLRDELIKATEHFGGVTYEAVHAMKFLDNVVAETLRKYTVTPFLQRESSEDYKIPDTGLLIEKGTAIIIPLHGIHRDPRYFPNPDKFDPDRFSEENIINNNMDVYLPMGGGPRNCIGERIGTLICKLGLIYILAKFKVERNSNTDVPLVYYPTHHLRTEKGIQLTFRHT